MKENQKFLGVYAPPSWLSASDRQEEEDKSPVFLPPAGSSSEVWLTLQSSPQDQAEARPVLACFPLSPGSPVSWDNPSGSACPINLVHVNLHPRFCFWAVWPKTPHDHLSSLRQTPLCLRRGRLHSALPVQTPFCRHGHPQADAWEEGHMAGGSR